MEECPNGPCATMFGPCVADTDCIGKKHGGSFSSQIEVSLQGLLWGPPTEFFGQASIMTIPGHHK